MILVILLEVEMPGLFPILLVGQQTRMSLRTMVRIVSPLVKLLGQRVMVEPTTRVKVQRGRLWLTESTTGG